MKLQPDAEEIHAFGNVAHRKFGVNVLACSIKLAVAPNFLPHATVRLIVPLSRKARLLPRITLAIMGSCPPSNNPCDSLTKV